MNVKKAIKTIVELGEEILTKQREDGKNKT